MDHYLEVSDLRVTFAGDSGKSVAVEDVSFYVDPGEVVCFVGESGSGKSVTQLAALQLLPVPPACIESGTVLLSGEDLMQYRAASATMRAIRGGEIGMIFQEPMTSLNPTKQIGIQIAESAMLHLHLGKKEAEKKAVELLRQVGIPDPESRLSEYPHQFSGGMRQRIMIAIAMASDPKIIVADEPTTALDVTTQAQILELLSSLAKKNNIALILITHNLGIVARYAERIYVMYAGNVVESGTSMDIFASPHHPYTKGLLKAVPRLDLGEHRLIPIDGLPPSPGKRQKGCQFANRCPYALEICETKPVLAGIEGIHFCACHRMQEDLDTAGEKEAQESRKSTENLGDVILEVKDLRVTYPIRKGLLNRKVGDVTILDGISFAIRRGETLGLVGESGCGKTTAARGILKLIEGTTGGVSLMGKQILSLKEKDFRPQRKSIQMIFQDPFSSLDPRVTVEDLVGEPLLIHKLVKDNRQYHSRVDELLELVGLDPALKDRVAHEFSGGQRQRVGIARALAADPDVIICDEPISALDVSIQAQIINLLEDLQEKMQLTYLFIAHDLAVVKHISHRVAVMYLGNIVEISDSEELYANARHPYTRALLDAIPIPDPGVELARSHEMLRGEVPSVLNRPAGCCFADRCIYAAPQCREKKPELVFDEKGHGTACYAPL
ncbi:MAG: ABC transporter ATP-binding protein [Blautia sp.]|nr:ABC transporter ATP-binding protein [Blautia sp.]